MLRVLECLVKIFQYMYVNQPLSIYYIFWYSVNILRLVLHLYQSIWNHIFCFGEVFVLLKGILSTSCAIFSYPKLLSISVLTFIKWRLTPSYAAKDTIFWQKRPKTIVISIIVWMTIFKSIHRPSMWTRLEHAHYLETINNMWFLGKRETVNAWKKTDFDGFRDKEE